MKTPEHHHATGLSVYRTPQKNRVCPSVCMSVPPLNYNSHKVDLISSIGLLEVQTNSNRAYVIQLSQNSKSSK